MSILTTFAGPLLTVLDAIAGDACQIELTVSWSTKTKQCTIRNDNDHEVLSYRRRALKIRQLSKIAGGRNYLKTANEKDLVALSKNLKVTKLGVNPLYSRFGMPTSVDSLGCMLAVLPIGCTQLLREWLRRP